MAKRVTVKPPNHDDGQEGGGGLKLLSTAEQCKLGAVKKLKG